jgi:hypothetical protein
MTGRLASTPNGHDEALAARRRAASLAKLSEALEHELPVPPPVVEVRRDTRRGTIPLLSAEALELARQVYFLNHGSMADAARAILSEGLADDVDGKTQSPLIVVRGRLNNWWRREQWPKRPTRHVFTIRDANHDGGLYRGRRCKGKTTGSGPAPAGKPCGATALKDSDYCWQHDPRPQYRAKVKRDGERLRKSRDRDMVPVGPFRDLLEGERQLLLAEARARGDRLDPKQTGWTFVAEKFGIDASIIGRIVQGTHNGAHQRNGGTRVHRIKAKTVVKYLSIAGMKFRDVYGFDPPAGIDTEAYTCPECGGSMSHGSKKCRTCYEAEAYGTRCGYINRAGEQCWKTTSHESGMCSGCRRILERRANARPRRGRTSFVTIPMLMLACQEYLQTPNLRWVSQAMWAVNAGGVRDVFANHKSLEGSLVKQFRKRGWSTPPEGGRRLRQQGGVKVVAEAVRAGLRELAREHGPVDWPDRDGIPPPNAAALVAVGPFRDWLAARYAEVGSYKGLQERIAMSDEAISQIVNRRGPKGGQNFVQRATVERSLQEWGDGTTFADLYQRKEGD